MIFNLQILRALAAVGVVIYHIDYHFVAGVHTEFMGVAIFFVISGFIMCFITQDRADGFLLNRVVRIVPLYWLSILALLLVMFGLRIFKASIWLDTPTWHPEEPIWFYVGRSLLFMPSDQFPVLGVGWTLNFEVYFYVIFAGALWISRRFAPLIAAGVILAVMGVHRIAPNVFLTRYYSYVYIQLFLDGIALFYAFQFVRGRLPRFIALPATLLLVACYAVQVDMPTAGNWLYVLPVVIVGSALTMAAAGADLSWRPLTLLGDASYALYLTHTILMVYLRRVAPWFIADSKTSALTFLGLLALCIGLGIAVHLYIEKPLLRAIRMMLAANATKSSAQTRVPEFTAADTKQ